jgi:hypothetical protein
MAEDAPAPTIDVSYIKSGNYREAGCDGAVGGPTPNGKVWIGFYTERLPVPRVVRHQLKATDDPEEFQLDTDHAPTPVEGRSGIVRNLEFGLYLTPDTAEELHRWLGRHLKFMKGEKS